MGCSPRGREESDTTEQLHFHFSLSCTGEGNGNPLQCSCLENPRDRGAWWAAVYGVAQSRTRLKQLSSSSSSSHQIIPKCNLCGSCSFSVFAGFVFFPCVVWSCFMPVSSTFPLIWTVKSKAAHGPGQTFHRCSWLLLF